MHRQHSCLARKPTGAPQSAQSRCRLPTGTARDDHRGGMDRPRPRRPWLIATTTQRGKKILGSA